MLKKVNLKTQVEFSAKNKLKLNNIEDKPKSIQTIEIFKYLRIDKITLDTELSHKGIF
jgi:hypothetical protein